MYIQSQKNPLSELALFWTAFLFLCILKTQSGMIGGVLLSCAKNHWNVIQFEKEELCVEISDCRMQKSTN